MQGMCQADGCAHQIMAINHALYEETPQNNTFWNLKNE
jgi:hypothetical protein